MADSVASLANLHATGISKVYRNRTEASKDIMDVLQIDKTDSIKIIGISLNDFVKAGGGFLADAWREVQDSLTSDKPPDGVDQLRVQVLLIDPECNGAFLRSRAEGTEGSSIRLHADVDL